MQILRRILDKNFETRGDLGFFGLGPWWTSTFSPAEQRYMEAAFVTPQMPRGARPLTRDSGLTTFTTPAALLTVLADRLSNRPEDRSLAQRVLAKAEERALTEDDILGLHYIYHQMIRLYSRWKDQFPDTLDLVFAACHKQMRLAPNAAQAFRDRAADEPLPTHLGYLQAATILEQQGSLTRAMDICRQAAAEGWSGNWSWRIQRMAKRLYEKGFRVRPISSSGLGPV